MSNQDKPVRRPTEGKHSPLPGEQRPGNSPVYTTGGITYTRDDITRIRAGSE